jgi:hypothetical protein
MGACCDIFAVTIVAHVCEISEADRPGVIRGSAKWPVRSSITDIALTPTRSPGCAVRSLKPYPRQRRARRAGKKKLNQSGQPTRNEGHIIICGAAVYATNRSPGTNAKLLALADMPRGTQHPARKVITRRLREYCAAMMRQFVATPSELWSKVEKELSRSEAKRADQDPPPRA